MQIYAFIDTNVLLHYAFFRDVDWAEVVDAPEVVVVLAPVVLGELDEHKWSGSRREKSRAKAVLKALDQLELSTVPARLRERVRIMAIADEPEDVVFRRQRLQGTVKDDRLLASLLHFRERVTCDGRVVLISADTGLRVKARSREIEVTRPDEPDETERQLVAAKAELAALQNAKPELWVIVDGATHSSFSVGLVRAYDPTTLKFKLEERCATQPHVQGWPGRPPRSGGGSPAESSWGLAELGLESSALEHKKTVERVFSAYEEFLMAWPEVVTSYRRTLRFDFVLENLGTGPAEDVDVVFSTDANGIWLNALPDLPQPPTMPRRRDWLGEPLGTPVVPSFGPEDFVHPWANVKGPDVEGEGRRIEFTVKRVKHHFPCPLDEVYFQFASNDDIRSFTINCRLVAANLRTPKVVALEVKVATFPGADRAVTDSPFRTGKSWMAG